VDRKWPPAVRKVQQARLSEELDRILQADKDGSLYADLPFRALIPSERGVRDIAFSGDGEPTTYRRFEEAVRIAAAARLRFGLYAAKLVLLTNARLGNRRFGRRPCWTKQRGDMGKWMQAREIFFAGTAPCACPGVGKYSSAPRASAFGHSDAWFRIRDAVPPQEE
jgi:hypothetical protein